MSDSPRLTRRSLLLGLAGASAGFAAVGAYWWTAHVRSRDTAPIVKAILKHHLGWLDIDPEAYNTFASEYRFQSSQMILSWAGLGSPLFQHLDLTPPEGWGREKFERLESVVVGDFLMSTDFFLNNDDTTRRVRFLGTWDEYDRPGANPLSNRVVQPCAVPEPQPELVPPSAQSAEPSEDAATPE